MEKQDVTVTGTFEIVFLLSSTKENAEEIKRRVK